MAAALVFAESVFADDAPHSQTLVERRLEEINDHQKVMFADAIAQGKDLDDSALKTRVEQLTHEYESLIRDSPNFAAGYAAYGYMLWRVGIRKQAIAMFLKANELDPDIPLVKNEIGNYLAEDGRPLEAVNYYLAAIKLDPNEPLYHYQLGTLLYVARDDFLRSGEWTADGIEHSMHQAFRRAAELAPDRIEFTYRYAESFYDLRTPDWPTALGLWKGLEAKSQSEVERETMRLHEANVLILMGKGDEARQLLDTVTEEKLAPQKQKLVARLAPNPGK